MATTGVAGSPELLPHVAPIRSGDSYPSLDGLRGIAVMCVVFTHLGFQSGISVKGTTGALLDRLDFGVTLFFLLSGFLLYGPFVRAHLRGLPLPSIRTYLRNRGLRVLPGYWVALAVILPVSAMSFTNPREIATQVLLLQVYTPRHLLPGLTQMWSLSVEVSFYLLLPLLALAVRRGSDRLRAQAWLCGSLVATSVLWFFFSGGFGIGHTGVRNLWLPSFLDWFALGMGLAVLRAWHDLTGRGRVLDQLGDAGLTCWAVGALLFWTAATPLAGPRGLAHPTLGEAVVRHWLYGSAALFLMLPAVFGTDQRAPLRRFLESRPMRWLGKVSYGVFLWHLLVLDLTFRVLDLEVFTGHFWALTACAVPGSLLAAALSLRLVEQPALNLKRRWATAGR
jgi:peptidoglycan/LPS O-acetylase OafA/YrhL